MVLSRRGAPASRHLFSVLLVVAGIISIGRSQENDLFQCPEGMINYHFLTQWGLFSHKPTWQTHARPSLMMGTRDFFFKYCSFCIRNLYKFVDLEKKEDELVFFFYIKFTAVFL